MERAGGEVADTTKQSMPSGLAKKARALRRTLTAEYLFDAVS